jgi:hypothetical protein
MTSSNSLSFPFSDLIAGYIRKVSYPEAFDCKGVDSLNLKRELKMPKKRKKAAKKTKIKAAKKTKKKAKKAKKAKKRKR